MPVAGDIVHVSQAQTAIRNITRLGDEILGGTLSERVVDLTPAQTEHAMDVLNRSFIYNNDGWCAGRAEYGLRAINEAVLGTASPADARAGTFATILHPYHTAPSVRDAKHGWLVLDPLTSPQPQTLDQWSMRWLRMEGFAKIEDPPPARTPEYQKELVHRFGGGLKEAWAIGQMMGKVEEPPLTQTRALMAPLRNMWDSQQHRLAAVPGVQEQLTGPYTNLVMDLAQ